MAHAWAPIHVYKDKRRVVIKPGDEVNEGDLAEDDWDLLRREGVIRDRPFPEDVGAGESVRTAILRQANEEYKKSTAVPGAYAILDPAPGTDEAREKAEREGRQVDDEGQQGNTEEAWRRQQ